MHRILALKFAAWLKNALANQPMRDTKKRFK